MHRPQCSSGLCYVSAGRTAPQLESQSHENPEWLKPGAYGAACGAIALAVVGFSWGGWVTGGNARQMAADQSRTEVVAALTAICLDQSKRDPQLTERLTILKATSAWSRGETVMKNGWATKHGTTDANP